ncbi:DUF421 domain-containing protein [Bacillus timonensis]|uniref:DUF421 domain-containing protein n=1 Tax=Bacillus timonensis TaxID=1033734 RepID=UPI000289579F|nr:DUF421 domain-containing protein [Bacillus timonensis]
MPEYLIIVIRSIISFIVLFILARILGKKQISQLTFFNYATGIAIGSMAAAVAVDSAIELLNGIIGLIVYSVLTYLIAFGAQKSFTFREIVESSPTVLIRDGKVLEKNLGKNKMTFDDLMTGLREKDAFKLADVELAVLETNGQLSVMKKSEKQPVTPKDLGIIVEEEHMPGLIIIDGHLLEKRLSYHGYTKDWLLDEIMKQGANDIKDVFLGQIDSNGNVYVDLYNDESSEQQVKQKPMLAAKLRKLQADLENYSLETNDPNARQMYYNQSKELQQMIEIINPYLK